MYAPVLAGRWPGIVTGVLARVPAHRGGSLGRRIGAILTAAVGVIMVVIVTAITLAAAAAGAAGVGRFSAALRRIFWVT